MKTSSTRTEDCTETDIFNIDNKYRSGVPMEKFFRKENKVVL